MGLVVNIFILWTNKDKPVLKCEDYEYFKFFILIWDMKYA